MPFKRPNPDSPTPPHGDHAAAAVSPCTFTVTVPARSREDTYSLRSLLDDHTEAVRFTPSSFARFTASSSSRTATMVRTGPKVSWRSTSISGRTESITVGAYQREPFWFLMPTPGPPASTLAPLAVASVTCLFTVSSWGENVIDPT